MGDTYTERILSETGLLKDYFQLFNTNQIEGEIWIDLNANHLLSIGITNKHHIDLILSKRDELFGISSQSNSLVEEVKIINNNDMPISLTSVVRAARSQTKNKTDSSEIVIRKVKSLDFSYKNLTKIDNLNQCNSLQCLSLSNNSITHIDGLEGLKSLRILSLESNLLQKIENLSSLVMLEKLYLDMNYIKRIEGLENLATLQELSVSNQQHSIPMEFDENSIVAISQSLKKLAAAGNFILDIGLF